MKLLNREAMPYRDCVGTAVFNDQGLVFIGRRKPEEDQLVLQLLCLIGIGLPIQSPPGHPQHAQRLMCECRIRIKGGGTNGFRQSFDRAVRRQPVRTAPQ